MDAAAGRRPTEDPAPDEPLDPVALAADAPESELADDDELVICWPTVRSTEATVPEMVDTSAASVTSAWAVATWVWAEAMLALSRAIWVAEAAAASSVASCAWSLASVAWAWARVASNAVGSTVASVCPALTTCPAATSTAVTRPATAKLRLAWLAGSIVPVAATVWVIVPVVTVWTEVVVVMPGVAAPEFLVANQVPIPAPTSTTATPPITMRFLRARVRCSGVIDASLVLWWWSHAPRVGTGVGRARRTPRPDIPRSSSRRILWSGSQLAVNHLRVPGNRPRRSGRWS